MSKLHKIEYFCLKMPFLFDVICSDKNVYNVNMTFSYFYPARTKGAIRPSLLSEKPKACRLHYFVTHSFLSYLDEYKKHDFPLEWQVYFSSQSKMPKKREYPYADDASIKAYMSSLICGSFKGALDKKSYQRNNIETERILYLTAELDVVRWGFLIHDCKVQKRLHHMPKERILRIYNLFFPRQRN